MRRCQGKMFASYMDHILLMENIIVIYFILLLFYFYIFPQIIMISGSGMSHTLQSRMSTFTFLCRVDKGEGAVKEEKRK